MKSSYNERFSFADPLAKASACRVTRHRAKKLKQGEDATGDVSQYQYSEMVSYYDGVSSDEGEDGINLIPCATKNSQSNAIVSTNLETATSTDYYVCNGIINHPQSLEFSDLVAGNPVPGHTDVEEDNEDDDYDDYDDNDDDDDDDDDNDDGDDDDDDDDNDDDDDDDDDDEPSNEVTENESRFQHELLYKEASITTSASRVLIMKYTMKHKLSREALADLLQILKLHCPFPNNVPSSLFHFTKHFKDFQYPVKYHYFCNTCLSEVPENAECCSNQDCSYSFAEGFSKSSFIELPIGLQLKSILERK